MIESLERRRLLTLVALDASFGDGGAVVDRAGLDLRQLLDLGGGRFARYSEDSLFYTKPNGAFDLPRTNAYSGSTGFDRIYGAVAATDGSITVLAGDVDTSETPSVESLQLVTLNANGTRRRTVNLTTYSASAPPLLAAGASGSVLLARVETASNLDSVVIRRVQSNGTFDSTYGTNGRATTQISATSANLGQELSALKTDASGRAYILFVQNRSSGGGNTEQRVLVRRFSAAGVIDNGYGAITLDNAFDTNSFDGAVAYVDADVTDSGVLAVLTSKRVTPDNAAPDIDLRFSRVGTAGGSAAALEFDRDTRPDTARVAFADDTTAYLTVASRGRLAEVYKINGTTFDADWSSFGSFASTTAAIDVSDLLFTGDRLLLNGAGATDFGADLILGVSGTREDYDVPQGSLAIQADGTLAVNGTDAADTIEVTSSRGRVFVEINGVTQSVPVGSVSGIFITGLAGKDVIGTASNFQPIYAIGGADNDRLIGGQSDDTLFGGDGKDNLDANGGNDDLYGQTGNDTLVGGVGADFIDGAGGRDKLYASLPNTETDSQADSLFGGGSVDIFDRDFPISTFPESNDVIDRTSSETVIT